jgi:hypothetical protein
MTAALRMHVMAHEALYDEPRRRALEEDDL